MATLENAEESVGKFASKGMVIRLELPITSEEIAWVMMQLNCTERYARCVIREKIRRLVESDLQHSTWTLWGGIGRREQRLDFSVVGDALKEEDAEAVYNGHCGFWDLK